MIKLKKIIPSLLILIIAIFILFLNRCEKLEIKEIKKISNKNLLNKIEVLKPKLDSIKNYSFILEKKYNNLKIKKDSVLIKFKNKYITIKDTINSIDVNYLSENNVDTIINVYEDIIINSDSIIKTKNKAIENLESQCFIKDTIIDNQNKNNNILENNLTVINKKLKKEKKQKWNFGLFGLMLGYIIGKTL